MHGPRRFTVAEPSNVPIFPWFVFHTIGSVATTNLVRVLVSGCDSRDSFLVDSSLMIDGGMVKRSGCTGSWNWPT